MDIKTYDMIAKKAKDIFEERQKKYGNSVDEVDMHTIVGLMKMKLHRIYTKDILDKTEDELLDCINYCIFSLEKFYGGNTK